MTWFKRHWKIVGPYLLIVAVFFGGLHAVEAEGHQRCLDRQADRGVLRQIVEISTQSTNGVVIDLTKVPGFDELDPQQQTYLRNLSEGLSHSTPTSRQALHDQLLAQLPPINC